MLWYRVYQLLNIQRVRCHRLLPEPRTNETMYLCKILYLIVTLKHTLNLCNCFVSLRFERRNRGAAGRKSEEEALRRIRRRQVRASRTIEIEC